jgi:hypothetical protein
MYGVSWRRRKDANDLALEVLERADAVAA